MGESGREGTEQQTTSRAEGRSTPRYRIGLGRPKAPQIVIRPVGQALVVQDPAEPSSPRKQGRTPDDDRAPEVPAQEIVERFAQLLPPDPVSRTVFVEAGVDLGPALERLDPVSEHLRDGERLRLVLDGVVPRDGSTSPAAQLATRIGREVLVPDGPVVLHPGGTLYVTHPDGPQWGGGRWMRFHPRASPVASGAHYPEPRWIEYAHRTLATAGRIAHGEVLGVPVPAGWVLRRIGSPAQRPACDLSFAVPVNDRWSTVLLGCGDEPAPDPDQVAGWLDNLVPELRSRIALSVQGDGPGRDTAGWPWAVAAALGSRIAVWTGVPLADDAGAVRVTVCSDAGIPAWCPPAGLLLVSPEGTCDVAAWQLPSGRSLGPCGPDPAGRPVVQLGQGWVCEIVACGLWIRPEDQPVPTGRRPVLDELATADAVTFVVGAEGAMVPSGVWARLPGLVDVMHPQMRRRLSLLVVGEVSVPGLNAVTAVTDRYKVACEFRDGLEG